MTSPMIADSPANLRWNLAKTGHQTLNSIVGKSSVTSQGPIEFINIGLMVPGVMDLHCSSVKIWLQGIIFIRQIR